MEFVDGYTLGDLLEKSGPLEQNVALKYMKQAAVGFSYLHEEKLIHRDIKPQNIMINKKGDLKIADFGISRVQGESHTINNEKHYLDGTAYYIAPEQVLKREEVDHRSDIYSLGATFFHLLSGKPPYEEKSVPLAVLAHVNKSIPKLIDRTKLISKDFNDLIYEMMSKNPDHRPQHMSEVVERLKLIENNLRPELKNRMGFISTSIMKIKRKMK